MEGGGWDFHLGMVRPVAALTPFLPFISTPRAHGLEDLLVASLIDLDSNRWHSKALRNLFMQSDNSLILHIYIIIRKHYHTYFELIHAFYS